MGSQTTAGPYQLCASTITSGEDAIWWAFVTVTTVGYGDEVPVTSGGRVVDGRRVEARLDRIEQELAEIRRLLGSSGDDGP